MEKENRHVRNLSTRAASYNEDEGTVEIVYSSGARVNRGTYLEDLIVSPEAIDTTRLDAGAVHLMMDHMPWGAPFGRVVSHRIENGQAIAVVKLSEADANRDAIQDIRAGVFRSVSVGYEILGFEDVDEDGITVRRVTRWMPWEISLVVIPADPAAHIRSGGKDNLSKRTEELVDEEIVEEKIDETKDALDAAAAAIADAQTAADEATGEVEEEETDTAADPAITAERSRVAEILSMSTRFGMPADFATREIAKGSTIDNVRKTIMDKIAGRSAAPISGARSSGVKDPAEVMTRQATEAVYARLAQKEPGAEAGAFRYRSLVDIAARFIQADAGVVHPKRVLMAATSTRTGLHTTSDFSFTGSLGAAVERRVRELLSTRKPTYEPFTKATTAPDFRPMETVSSSSFPDLREVAEGGEVEFGTLTTESGTFSIKSFGRAIAFSFQAMINDDLRLIDSAINGAASKYEKLKYKLVFDALLDGRKLGDNKPVFHATRGNVITATLDETGLEAAEAVMRAQTDMEGEPMDLEPRVLLVGQQNAGRARRLLAPVTATRADDVNIYSGANIQVIIDPRITGTEWYLLGDKAAGDYIELAALSGYEGLQVERLENSLIDGVTFVARSYLGAHPSGWRGFVKSTGTGV